MLFHVEKPDVHTPHLYLIFLRINARSEKRGFPAIHVLLRVTGQLDLTQVLIHVPAEVTKHAHESTAHLHKHANM